jgi:hemerythrin-like domain-containing protein
MTPTEDLINEHKAIKVMLSIMSKIAENIKANKGYYIKDIEQIVIS